MSITTDREHALETSEETRKKGEPFSAIAARRITRRAFLKHAAAGSAAAVIMSLGACAQPPDQPPAGGTEPTEAPEAEPTEASEAEPTEAADGEEAAAEGTFEPVDPEGSGPIVPAGYMHGVLISWGDPVTADAPAFDPENQTAAAQEQQFGYNCDFVGFFPLPQGSDSADQGLLAVSHEYTSPELMFPGYDFEAEPSKEIVDIELAAHGFSIIEVSRNSDGSWSYDPASSNNRRVTATTPMDITGPAAGHALLQTSEDPDGTTVNGTMNNCAGGKTPWGTFVSAEENFHQYFSNLSALEDDDPVKAMHERYGLPEEVSDLQWNAHYDRFDLAKEPNEPFRYGWVVETDPYDPGFTPKKRTALGRFRHEAATFVIAPDDRVVSYSGDDERFEYVYKFISEGTYSPDDREANMDLLDAGTLYVAKFNEDGTGEWMPLIYGEGPLTEENGFESQADILINTRMAADLLEPTPMDRPEDIETNPVNQKVYIALTNNSKREEGDTNAANPRPDNQNGHVIELTEEGDDPTATTFAWEIFLLCGPADDESTDYAGFDKSKVSPIACPDNVTFDTLGNLWIATDGMGKEETLGVNDACFMVPVEGPNRGFSQQFFVSVDGSEVCGPEFTPDDTTLFLAIQHPGEGGTYDDPVSTWPGDTTPPRPSVVFIHAEDGGPIIAA